jgi:hypothetical protein
MTLIESLKRVASLQPHYTYENTPEMRDRMAALREASSQIEETEQLLSSLSSRERADMGVEASDGLGRKAEAPWIRIYSKALAPSARDGFYLVIHFPIDGVSIFVTLGCGATKYENGSLRNLPTEELQLRSEWARNLLGEAGYLESFPDVLDFGSSNSRPKAYESATAIAKRFLVEDLDRENFVGCLREGLAALDLLYEAQMKGEHLDEGEKQIALIEETIKPSRVSKGRQGFGLTASQRRLVELRGMLVATALLESKGYEVSDVSSRESYDLLARSSTEVRKIEVKASTSSSLQSIVMTHNEVRLHTDITESTGLVLVSGIKLNKTTNEAHGGIAELLLDWSPEQWFSEPIAFRLTR